MSEFPFIAIFRRVFFFFLPTEKKFDYIPISLSAAALLQEMMVKLQLASSVVHFSS